MGQIFTPETTWKAWLRRYRVPLLWALLLLLLLPMRDLWAPDEPDFAQCVREMREHSSWLLPYMNGVPYSEKPILFYWLMKACVIGGDWLFHGFGFTQGIAAWALRLPSVAASIAFAFAFRSWAARFWDEAAAEPATLIICTIPIWFWQSQFIQIDFVFCALLAWAWMAFLAGYLLERGHCPSRRPGEASRWFLGAYISLALAFLSKGPLALVLSIPLLLAFLAWQRDWSALRRMRLGWGLLLMALIIAPWYIAAGMRGGARYIYELIIYQNFDRATHAWDHINPWWYYSEYLITHVFPWCLLVIPLVPHLWRQRKNLDPRRRFLLLAFALPVVLLSLSQSKQGKYIMMVYPFLALLLSDLWSSGLLPSRRQARLLAFGIALPALALLVVALSGAGGNKLQAPLLPFRLMIGTAGVLMLGASLLTLRGQRIRLHPVNATALGMALLYLVAGTWGFRLLDPLKNYREWTRELEPLTAGHRVFYWQTIHCGVMVYSSHQMPELHTWSELEQRLGPDDLLVAIDREWFGRDGGMTPERRQQFDILLKLKVGGGDSLLLRKKKESA